MTRAGVFIVVVMLGVGGSSALQGQDALAAKTAQRCSGQRRYRSDRNVTVYRRRVGTDGVGNPLTGFFACARPDGASVQFASDSADDGEYPPDDVLTDLVLAGDYAGSIMVQGDGDQAVCQKYSGDATRCPTPITVIFAADARNRELARIVVPSGAHGLLLSPSHGSAGAAVWLEPAAQGSTLVGSALVSRGRKLSSAPDQLDTGDITGVHLSGQTVTWLDAGVAHQATLDIGGSVSPVS